MKLAFTTLACPDWSLDQVITAAQNNNYAGLEFRMLDGELLTSQIDTATRNDVQRRCSNAGLKIVCVDTSIRIATRHPEELSAQLREGNAFLEIAASWDAPFIRVFGGESNGLTAAESTEIAVECLTLMAQRGRELGVTVLLETHDAFCRSAAVMAVLNRVPDAGAIWDTLHPFRFGERPVETATCLGDRCCHVHIKDGRRGNGDVWDLTLLGEGEVPISEILSTLQDIHYDGWLSVEWEKKWHPEIAAPEIALPQHAQQLAQYLGMNRKS